MILGQVINTECRRKRVFQCGQQSLLFGRHLVARRRRLPVAACTSGSGCAATSSFLTPRRRGILCNLITVYTHEFHYMCQAT